MCNPGSAAERRSSACFPSEIATRRRRPVIESNATKTPQAKIFLVDDHAIVREGLALLINREPDLTICGDAEEAGAALSRIEELRPDLVVLDISLVGPDGLDLLKIIRQRDPDLPVLVLSMHD